MATCGWIGRLGRIVVMDAHGRAIARRGIVFAILLALGAASAARAQGAAPESGSAAAGAAAATDPSQRSPGNPPEAAPPAPLVVHTDTIAILRATVAGVPPVSRVEIARARLEALKPGLLLEPVRIEQFADGYMVLVGDTYAFMFFEGDRDPGGGQDFAQAAMTVRERLETALAERARLLSPGQRLRAAIAAVVGTVVLFILLRLLAWVRRRAMGWIESKSKTHAGRLRLGDMDFLTQFSAAASWIVRAAAQIGGLVLVAMWVVFVLNRFPETQRWGFAARKSMIDVLVMLETGLFRAIPGLVGVAVIVLIARFLTRLVSDIFASLERGTMQIRFVHPETAGATRRLVIVLVWLFAVVVAYPLVPGSGSDAFKGVSVFLGLIITLGSSGVVGHMMSGLVVVYSRSLKVGDLVRVNDTEGMVTEVGALSVKLANAKNEEFTIPNAVIVGTTVKNYSRVGGAQGAAISTSVTIGYDAPWRVVYEILLAAADRTTGIRKSPAPVVYQPVLSDFFVEYHVTGRLEAGANRLVVLSELHQNIQDAFNERGVQIMSPHFEGQPAQPVVVPKAKWSRAPGDTERPGGG